MALLPHRAPEARASIAALDALLRPHLAEGAASWLDQARAKIAADAATMGRYLAEAGRRVGRGPLFAGDGAEKIMLLGEGRGPVMNPWHREDVARSMLLLSLGSLDAGSPDAAVRDAYYGGDLRERIAVLRTLALLAVTDDVLLIVHDAIRSSAADLLAAAVCENEFSSARLSDEMLFQATVKCLLSGIRIDRIARIEERANPELTRMLAGYVSERDRAGRSVAAEVWPIVALYPPPGAVDRMAARVAQATDPYERRLLEVALSRAKA